MEATRSPPRSGNPTDSHLSRWPEQAARISIIAVCDDTVLPVWHLLADGARVDYFCTCLIEAKQELGGMTIDHAALTSARRLSP
jgi:hypothetical protein